MAVVADKACGSFVIRQAIADEGARAVIPSSVSYVGLVPAIVFWLMDARYLRLERLYWKFYDHIGQGNECEPFSMDTSKFKEDVSPTLRIAISWSVIRFYLTVAVAPIILLILLPFRSRVLGVRPGPGSSVHRHPSPQLRQAEYNATIAPIYRPDNIKWCSVLADLLQLAVARRPAARCEVAAEHDDFCKKWEGRVFAM